MAQTTEIKLTIDIDGEILERVFSPKKIKLKTQAAIQEAQASGKWRDLFPVIGGMLNLTIAQVEEMTTEQFEEITAAIQRTTDVPNESAPPSEQPSEGMA